MSAVELKRLAFVKYLYKAGLDQSYMPEPMNATALLSFHDASELFLQLVLDHYQITFKPSFMGHWEEIKSKTKHELTQKASMRRLNDARVNLKHHGTLPSKLDVEEYRVTATNFFKDNVKPIFGIDFEAISLIDLVQLKKAKDALQESQVLVQHQKRESALWKLAIAFDMLITDYETRKQKALHRSPFFFGQGMPHYSAYMMGLEHKGLGAFIETASVAIGDMQRAMKILSLGIDYRRYSKFRLFTPEVGVIGAEYFEVPHDNEVRHSEEDYQYCLDFVIETAILLQDFDYDVSTARARRQ